MRRTRRAGRLTWWDARAVARAARCAHCEVRPRARLANATQRFCSSECAEADVIADRSIA